MPLFFFQRNLVLLSTDSLTPFPHAHFILFLQVNILVNNAGIQRFVDLQKVPVEEEWSKLGEELEINLDAPIHLSMLFVPHLLKQQNPAIINVTSGLSFFPFAKVPVYSATKAALHSFTLSLRFQLANTNVRVVEIVPPAVDTDLNAPGLHKFGVNVDEFADGVWTRLRNGELEIGYGMAEKVRNSSRQELDETFALVNKNHP